MGIFGGGDEDEIKRLQRQKKAKERAQKKAALRAYQAGVKAAKAEQEAAKRRQAIRDANKKKK
jgi:hypothetical protein